MSKLRYETPTMEGEVLGEEQLMQQAQLVAENRAATRMNRRRLLTNLGMAAGAASMLGVAGCSNDGTVVIPSPSTTPSVNDVLNFALNLEYFEATYYSFILTGAGIPVANQGPNPGTVTGGAKVTFQYSSIANIAANLAAEELQHVQFLQAAITNNGGTPVSLPSLNLQPLPAYAVTNDAQFVTISRALETVGTSAYEGAAQYLTSVPTILTYAAAIHDLEAQHEGALRQACIFFPGGTAQTSPAVDALDLPPTMSAIFNTNPSTGLNTVRTVSQVLGIVYGASTSSTTTPAAGITKGGFFPNGFNGNIFST